MSRPSPFNERLASLETRIAQACQKAGRPREGVKLMTVSKLHDADKVQEAVDAGIRLFGENRVQEAAGKFPALEKSAPDIDLHLIGPLQTNKAKKACETFDAIQTLDRPALLDALRKLERKGGEIPALFVQINIGAEPQKAGVDPQDAPRFIEQALSAFPDKICGLMAIPPHGVNPAPYFSRLAELGRQFGLKELSMGMSGDFERAIALGATIIRVGSALFGARQ